MTITISKQSRAWFYPLLIVGSAAFTGPVQADGEDVATVTETPPEACGPVTVDADLNLTIPCAAMDTTPDGPYVQLYLKRDPKTPQPANKDDPESKEIPLAWEFDLLRVTPSNCQGNAEICAFFVEDGGLTVNSVEIAGEPYSAFLPGNGMRFSYGGHFPIQHGEADEPSKGSGKLLHMIGTDNCLHISSSPTNGRNIHMWSCNRGTNSLWDIEQISGTTYRIRLNSNRNYCIHKKGGDNDIHLWTCNGGDNEKWTLTRNPKNTAQFTIGRGTNGTEWIFGNEGGDFNIGNGNHVDLYKIGSECDGGNCSPCACSSWGGSCSCSPSGEPWKFLQSHSTWNSYLMGREECFDGDVGGLNPRYETKCVTIKSNTAVVKDWDYFGDDYWFVWWEES